MIELEEVCSSIVVVAWLERCASPVILLRAGCHLCLCLQMKMRENASAQREAAEQRRLADLGKEGVEDEQLQAQRQLDDWKDDHQAGYGNSKLRPCAL